MNHGRIQLAEGELREPKKKKVKPGMHLRDPYPIIFWNKLGIPPCKELWPAYMGVFDGDSVIVEDPRDMHEISTMGYFGKRLMCRRGYEQSIGDVPVVRERQWKRRVEWAAECGYVLVPPDKGSVSGSPDRNAEVDAEGDRLAEAGDTENVDSAEGPGDEGTGQKSGVANGCGEGGLDVSVQRENQGEVDGHEKAGAATEGGEDDQAQVSEGCGSPSVARGRHGGDEREALAGECRVHSERTPLRDDEEEVTAVLEGQEECGHGMAASGGNREDVESGKPLGEEGGGGNVPQSCEAAMDISTRGPSSVGDRVDRSGEGGESPGVTLSKEGDSKRGGDARGETGMSSLVEVESAMGAESPVGKVDIASQSKVGGSARGCQGTRRSPRSTRSSASKLKESGDCDSLVDDGVTKAAHGVARGHARRSLRKSVAGEGMGDASDSKGDTCKALNAGDAISEEEGSVPDVEGKEKQLEVTKEKENLVDLVSETVDEEMEGGKALGCKIGKGSLSGQEKLKESVNIGEVEGEEEGKCNKGVRSGEGLRTPRRSSRRVRGSKRNWSPSSEGGSSSSGKKFCSESGDGNGEEVNEDSTDVAAVKRLKVSDAAPEELVKEKQLEEEVTEKKADGCLGETGEGSTSSKQELAKGAVEDEGSDSGEKTKVNEPCSVEGLDEEKIVRTSLNKSSSDCEIVEIEDESNTQSSIVPEGGEVVPASTPHKCSEDTQAKDTPCVSAADSDDDIMEVSIEEEEVREVARDGQMIVNRRRSSSNLISEGTVGSNNGKDLGEPDKVKFQKLLKEIWKNLPNDIEVTEVNLKNLNEAEAVTMKEPLQEASIVDNDDDDVIEINLQKSDMMELEGCAEEVADRDDAEGECGRDQQTSYLRRRMRKESSGFHRKEREGFVDSLRPKQDAEVESIATGNQGSICEVAPCIVIPDSDSDVEESQGSPRLESDPSVFLPSLDVLQLIPEEAFFLAYGLGCLVVWDARNIDLDPNKCEDNQGGKSSDELKPHKVVKVENGDLGNKVGNVPPLSTGLDEGERTHNALDPFEIGGDGPSKSVNRCDMGYQPGSSNRSMVTSSSAKDDEVETLMVAPSKSDSVEGNKFPLNQTEPSNSPEMSSMEGVLSKEALDKKSSSADDSADVGQEIKIPEEKLSGEEVGVLSATNKSDEAPVESLSQQNETNLESRNNEEDVVGEKRCTSPADSNGIKESSGPPKENGVLGDPSITVIDLADSPPSRQWAGKSWPSQDEEDVVAMDTDVSLVDPEPSVPENPSERTLHSEYRRPMSILELWNAFRSCRASVSSSIPFETTYAVYHHFRSKRWVVKPGIRFGGDFLLYKDGPPFYHASYLVVIDSYGPDGESKFDWKMLSGMNRLAENIAKDLMLCRVEWPPTVTEKELLSPECLMGLVVQEVLVRRWVSLKERDAEDHAEEEDDDRESYIPLKLNL